MDTDYAEFRKEPPPVTGDKFVPGWGQDHNVQTRLPSGGMLSFNTSTLDIADFDAMRVNPQINSSLNLMKVMLHRVPWRLEAPEKYRKTIEDNLKDMWPELVSAACPALWAGHSPIVLEYENDFNGRIALAKCKDLHPGSVTINWKEVEGWRPPGAESAPKIKVYDGINLPGQGAIPAINTLWYPLMMQAGNYHGTSLLRSAYVPWFLSNIVHLYNNRYLERFGEPVVVARAPLDERRQDPDDETKSVSGLQVAESVMASIRNRASVALPNDHDPESGHYDYTLEYLEGQLRGVDFERYLTRLDEEMSLAVFTPLLLYRTADVGSYNLGETHMRVFLWSVNHLIDDFLRYVNRYVVRRLVDVNFGPTRRNEVKIRSHHLGTEAEATLRQMITALIQRGDYDVNEEDLSLALSVDVTRNEMPVSDRAQQVLQREQFDHQTERDDATADREVAAAEAASNASNVEEPSPA